jgi:hypothetical protein
MIEKSAGLTGKPGASSENGSGSQGEDSRDSEDDDTPNIEINVTRTAVPSAEAFIVGTVEARDVDTPTSPGPEAGLVNDARANFLVLFTKASLMSEGHFEPDLARLVFFFAATLALFLAASALASVLGYGREAYSIPSFSKS